MEEKRVYFAVLPLPGLFLSHTRCQPLPRVAGVDGAPAKPDVYIRSKACGLESASHTRFEENVASSTPRRMEVSDDCAGLQVNVETESEGGALWSVQHAADWVLVGG